MNWLLWSAVGTGAYVLLKRPAALAPAPTTPTTPTQPAQPAKPKSPIAPTTVTKAVITGGRKYLVTRAGLGIYKVVLASDPTVFQLISQTGPLQEGGDPAKLAQLKADEAQFPGNLFA